MALIADHKGGGGANRGLEVAGAAAGFISGFISSFVSELEVGGAAAG